MRIVFMGTPTFAVSSLGALADKFDVTLVVTRPDAVRGRGRELEPSAVKAKAVSLGIPVLEAARMTPEVKERIAAERPDVIAVAAYGCIIPDDVIAMPRLEIVNVHASLLPRWRGAAPIQRAILARDERAGVSIMRIAHGIDVGAYCRQASVEVGDMDSDELTSALADIGARELVAALEDIEAGAAVWTEQDESLVTHAPKVTKAEMRLDPSDAALTNALRVRASSDAAPARAIVCGRGLRVLEASVVENAGANALAPGEAIVRPRLVLGCSDGALEIDRVKPDGKREMSSDAFAAGLREADARWERA